MSELAIITNNPTASGTIRLQGIANSIGINTIVVPVSSTTAPDNINSARAAIFRISPLSYVLCEALLPHLGEPHKKYLEKCLDAFDKGVSTQILTAAKILMPESRVIAVGDLHKEENFPFIIKVTRGNRGAGVYLIDSPEVCNEIIEAYPVDQLLVHQEYIEQSKGRDKRLFVVGDQVVAAMERTSTTEDFRANIHLGGKASIYFASEEEMRIAVDATRAHGLIFAGVDIIDSSRGPLVLEVNPSPGLAIESITGIDVAEKIIKETLRGYND